MKSPKLADTTPVQLAFLTFTENGQPILNIKESDELVVWMVPVSYGHLANIVADGAEALAKLARRL